MLPYSPTPFHGTPFVCISPRPHRVIDDGYLPASPALLSIIWYASITFLSLILFSLAVMYSYWGALIYISPSAYILHLLRIYWLLVGNVVDGDSYFLLRIDAIFQISRFSTRQRAAWWRAILGRMLARRREETRASYAKKWRIFAYLFYLLWQPPFVLPDIHIFHIYYFDD